MLGMAAGTVPVRGESGAAADLTATPAGDPARAAGNRPPPRALLMLNPLEGTLVPRDLAPITFRWRDEPGDKWRIQITFEAGGKNLDVVVTENPEWTPTVTEWEEIKQGSLNEPLQITVQGVQRGHPDTVLSENRVAIRTSRDPVGAPIFYREIALPIQEAAKNPSQIRWRLGSVAALGEPRVVLEKMPVCGNCHSFSQDGKVFAMDVDYRSKGAYFIKPVTREMRLGTNDMIDWAQFAPGEKTFGLLSQLSPDGRLVASTVRDRSVFIAEPELEISQRFFPVQGILAIYRRAEKSFYPLPGADDPAFVQTNPVWSPDGQTLVFARAQAYYLSETVSRRAMPKTLNREFDRTGRPFQYDLYRIPYNDGRGGAPEPLRGASRNGKSNFFPKFSPDGKWIVFCQAANYMMLQPDSELYLVPAAGGEARRLSANTRRMNSWHSWSPNSKWLVFSSKAQGPYTQLHLTHIDDQGNDSPAICLERFSSPNRAANLPEFVHVPADGLESMETHFARDWMRVNAGNELFKEGDVEGAMAEYREALALDPANFEAHQRLGLLLFHLRGQTEEGLGHLREAARLAPENAYLNHDLGMALLHRGSTAEAVARLTKAVALLREALQDLNPYDPAHTQYQLGLMLSPRHRKSRSLRPYPEMEFHLGLACFLARDFAASATHLGIAVSPGSGPANNPQFRYLYALALAAGGEKEDAAREYARAIKLRPEVIGSLKLEGFLGENCADAARFQELIASAEKALK